MGRIIIQNMSFSYADYYYPVFNNVNLNLDTSWKLGLIGRNGRGKTTFLRLLNEELIPNEGRIVKDITTNIFTSDGKWENGIIALNVIKEIMGGLYSLENQLASCQNQTGSSDRFLALLEQYEHSNGYQAESKIKKEIYRMGLSADILMRKFSSLFGGEQSKILIIGETLRPDHFVLFDEPTNHLDTKGRESIARYLSRKKGFIVVTHDRNFLDLTVDHILAIHKTDITLEKGNYSSWLNNVQKKNEYEMTMKKKLEDQIGKMELTVAKKKDWADSLKGKKYSFRTNARSPDKREAKLRKNAKRTESNILNSINEKKKLLRNFEVVPEMNFRQQETEQPVLLSVKNLSFSYGGPRVLEGISFVLNQGDRLWIRGNNGAGKTTLMQLLSGNLKGYSGTVWKNGEVQISMSTQINAVENEKYTELKDKASKDLLHQLLAEFDISEEHLQRPLDTWSSGELHKFNIACALASPNHILLLDEPLNYMDVYFVEQFEKAILKIRPTMVFIEHDEQFGSEVHNKILELL